MKQNDWEQINDVEKITEICKNIISDEPKLVQQYLSGKNKMFSALLGKIANTTNQRVNMEQASIILKELLKK